MKRLIASGAVAAMVLVGAASVAPSSAGAKGPTPGSTEIGGNYNQSLCDIYGGLIARSGVQWVRTFVNIPRNFLSFDSSNQLVGVLQSNLSQVPNPVGGQGENLGIATATKLQQLKHTGAPGEPVKTVLSLKLDMKCPDLAGHVPSTIAEVGIWNTAIAEFLNSPSSSSSSSPPDPSRTLGASIDVLVVGNEPMFEVPKDQAEQYATFLNSMINFVAGQRASNGWHYQIFTGALDKPGQNTTDPILQKVIAVTNSNPQVDGLDLHLHEDKIADIATDLDYIRKPTAKGGAGVTKPLKRDRVLAGRAVGRPRERPAQQEQGVVEEIPLPVVVDHARLAQRSVDPGIGRATGERGRVRELLRVAERLVPEALVQHVRQGVRGARRDPRDLRAVGASGNRRSERRVRVARFELRLLPPGPAEQR